VRLLPRLWNRLVDGLALLGGASLGAACLLIAVDVTFRNVGLRPVQASSALTEYALLFSTMTAGPWLVREHGHIAVTSFIELAPTRLRRIVGVVVSLVAVATLALLAWRSTVVGMQEAAFGALDIRSIDIPAWIAYAILATGFSLMAVEFLRLAVRGEPPGGSGGAA
jgi:TRAP-type C4-dicarboxylate transport system permease small subunit